MRVDLDRVLAFVAVAVFVTMTLESVFHVAIFGEGLGYFASNTFWGGAVFQALLAAIGAVIHQATRLRPREMGLLSLAVGLGCELAWMRPPPAAALLSGVVNGDTLAWLAVTGLYWFADWFIPSVVVER